MNIKDGPRRENYVKARWFLMQLSDSTTLSTAQKERLRRQALDGDLDGARAGYEKILREAGRIGIR